MLETIDHVTTGVDRLSYKLSQENIIKLLTVFLEKAQEIEESFIELADQKSIELAEGIYLDYIGKIVGVDRDGLDDEDYRSALQFQIGVNTADGTNNIIIDLIKQYTGSSSASISESGIAFATLSINGQENTESSVYDLLQEIKPVGTRFIIHSDYYDNNFKLAYESNTSSANVFQVSDNGSDYENFQVSSDGLNYELFFSIEEAQSYYNPSLYDGRNNWYYEEPIDFQVSSDGENYENLQVTSILGLTSDLSVVTPYTEDYIPINENTLWWEIEEDSLSITEIGEEDMRSYNDIYNSLSLSYTTTTSDIMEKLNDN